MYKLKKVLYISSSHNLREYQGKCQFKHGHNWKITVRCQAEELNATGMVVDFTLIKTIVMKYDHADLNKLEPFDKLNPTAENMAKVLCMQIRNCVSVTVQETEGAEVTYEL